MLATERVAVLVTLSAAALVTAVIAAAPADPDRARVPPAVALVPIAGASLAQVVDDAQARHTGCLPFIAPVLAHPNWSLQLVDGGSTCTGDYIHASFEVGSDGWVTWTEPRMPPRSFRLTLGELATIRHLDELDCAAPPREPSYASSWVRVGVGGDMHATGGAALPPESAAGQAIEQLFDRATERYVRARRAALGTVTLDMIARIDSWEPARRYYRVRIANDRLIITRGKRTVTDVALDAADLVKLVDWALHTAMPPATGSLAHGMLTAGKDRQAIAIDWWDREVLGVSRTIEDAMYGDGCR